MTANAGEYIKHHSRSLSPSLQDVKGKKLKEYK